MVKNRKKNSKENKENQMPRRKLFLYSPTMVQKALTAIENGTSVLQASKIYQVPRSTLRHKLKGEAPLTSGRVGPESILGTHVEQILVDWLLEACKRGFPINKDGLVGSAKKFIESQGIKTPFKNNTPGRKWLDGFLKRHPILSVKKAEYLSMTRAAVTEGFIRKWFTEVQLLLKDNLEVFEDSTRVFNMDETAMYLAPKGGFFIAEKGKPTYDVSTSSDKENITTLFTVNAAGEILPPLTVYKYERLPKSCVDAAPPDWGIGKTENGWMTYVTFYEYFTNVFNPYLEEKKIKKPVIVFLDGHVSHMSYHLSVFCKEHQIILCCLPPNATHLLQPLDVSVFAPLKKHWLKFVKNWRIEHNGLDIQKFDVPVALSSIIKKTDFENTIKAGFRRCGLYPFDPDAVNYERCVKQTNSSNFNEHGQNTLESLSKQLSLEYFEKNINKDILKQFKDLKKNNLNWIGAIEYSALFDIWSKMYTDAYSDERIPDEPLQSIDTLNLDLEQCQIILHDEPEVAQVIPTQSSETDINLCGEVHFEKPVIIEIVSDEAQSLTEMKEDNLSQFEIDNEIKDTPIIFQNIENVTNDTISNKICDKNDSECDKNIVSNNKSSVENALKNILVWPEAKTSKNKKQKERLPSVLTSDTWLSIMKNGGAKEEEKLAQLQKKEETKRITLEKSEVVEKLKLEAKRIKQEKIEAASQIKSVVMKKKEKRRKDTKIKKAIKTTRKQQSKC